MKEQQGIPTSKVARATKVVTTGAKIGGNYIKHYTKKAFNSKLSKEELDKANAEDIYESLSTLKGSALKVAQMMSMDQNVLPESFVKKFSQAQYSAPALSYPLVVRTFEKSMKKKPTEVFDEFSRSAVNAASIGQVHMGKIANKKFAIKVQYPGVADSIQSDLKMVKPIALRMLKTTEKEIGLYLKEVENMLMNETDYILELNRSVEITKACSGLEGIVFPSYHPELSTNRILTMDWLDGLHLAEFIKTNPSQETRNLIGQRLWDFYDFQMHQLRKVHADPHPGNFLIQEDGTIGILDFGCVKVIPEDFYPLYFKILSKETIANEEKLILFMKDLRVILPEDTPEQRKWFIEQFRTVISLLMAPFQNEIFDFGNDLFFKQLYEFGEEMSQSNHLKESNAARGNQNIMYLNRTYFGLYSLLNELKAEIKITNSSPYH